MDLSSGVNQGADVEKETDRVFRGAIEVRVFVRQVLGLEMCVEVEELEMYVEVVELEGEIGRAHV